MYIQVLSTAYNKVWRIVVETNIEDLYTMDDQSTKRGQYISHRSICGSVRYFHSIAGSFAGVWSYLFMATQSNSCAVWIFLYTGDKNMQLVWIEHTTFRLTVTESLQSDALPTELKLQQNPRRESNSQSFD